MGAEQGTSMGWLEAVLLGVLQGLTEFLPISSSAHIRIAPALFDRPDAGAAFTAVIQLGTEAAVLIYFRKDIWNILRTWTLSLWRKELRRDPAALLGWWVIVGTLPIVVLGLLYEEQIEGALRNLWIVATVLILGGLILGAADYAGRKMRHLESLTGRDAVILGFAQAAALIPGVSRSGGTITAGLLLGFTRAEAARYSFLLAIPAVLGAGVKQLGDIGGANTPDWGATIIATIAAFLVGYVVIAVLLRYLAKGSYLPFVIYRVVLGVALYILLGTDVLAPLAGVPTDEL